MKSETLDNNISFTKQKRDQRLTLSVMKNFCFEVLQSNTIHEMDFYTNYSLTQYSLDGGKLYLKLINEHEM